VSNTKQSNYSFDPFKWFKYGALLLFALTIASTLVFYFLGQYYGRDNWTILNCLFMVVITLTTIGYGDWLNIQGLALAEIYTMFLAIVGVGVPAFVISNVTALIVEGMFSEAVRRKRMAKQIGEMRDHIIICGVGTTGYHCLEELSRTGRPFVAIDMDEDRLNKASRDLGDFPFIAGSAEEDSVLKAAGVERASGLIACLTEDKDNVYVTLSARAMNPNLRIVSKVVEDYARSKLVTAGANAVVNTTAIGGMRVVSELIRPTVVTFLDTMLREKTGNYRFEEVVVSAGSKVDGKTLSEARLRDSSSALVVGIKAAGEQSFTYNPSADIYLRAGTVVVVLASSEDLERIRPAFTSA
jgi:voltage-gated potassium channel